MARILGLDIGNNTVRGALVRTAMRRAEVLQYVEVPLSLPSDPQGRAEALSSAIRSVAASFRPAPEGVVTAVDGSEASLRVVDLPAGAAKRIGEVLPFELESVLPFPVEEAVVDYQPIDRVGETIRVLATAAPRARISARLAELNDAGIDPRELAVGAAALDGLVALVPALQSPGPHVIIDVRETSTDVCILHNGKCELARTLSFGTDALMGTGSADATSSAFATALHRTMIAYRAAGGTEPATVFVAGQAATMGNVAEWIGSILATEAHVLPLPPVAGADDMARAAFARAAALGGRLAGRGKRIDLRQGEFAMKRAMGALRQHARLIAICAGVVFAAFVFSTWARWAVLDGERDALREELAGVTKELFGSEIRSAAMAREQLEGGRAGTDPMPRFDAFDALHAMSSRIPGEVTHDTRRLVIEIDDEERSGRFEIQGTVDNQAAFDGVAAALDDHECFGEVTQGRTTPAPGQEKLNYQMEGAIRCPGDGPPPGASKNRNARRPRGGN